ncbi:MAG: CcmD family protein [Bacteroidota bacterium]
MKNKIILILTGLLFPFFGIAQEVTTSPDMADAFRRDGKIYVVITVLAIIFICLIGYLVSIDLKLRKLENKH